MWKYLAITEGLLILGYLFHVLMAYLFPPSRPGKHGEARSDDRTPEEHPPVTGGAPSFDEEMIAATNHLWHTGDIGPLRQLDSR